VKQQIRVHSFLGWGSAPEEAQQKATAELQAWYAEQRRVYWSSGPSVFQFNLSMCALDSNVINSEASRFLCTITVFDTRLDDEL